MKVVVTGGAGYLGSAVAQTLLRHGHHVTVLDSLIQDGHAVAPLYLEDNFRFVRGDIRSEELLNTILPGNDAVVHLAAIVGDPACAAQPELARDVNLTGTLQVFGAARRHDLERFVFASTCSNYGRMAASESYVDEESELNPKSLYAETKVGVERGLLDMSDQHDLDVSILRFATLFGLSPRMRFDLTVNEFTAELLTKRKLEVYGQQFWRPYIHVRDAARAVAQVLEAPRSKVAGQVFNAGDTSQNYTKGKLVEEICRRIGGEFDIDYVHREEDPRDYRVSFEKIKQELDFQITRTVPDGIGEIVDAINQGVIRDLDSPRYRNTE